MNTAPKATPTGQVGATENTTADNKGIVPDAPLALQYSVFRSKNYKGIGRHTRTWSYLMKSLEQPGEFPSKDACPLIKLATFGDLESAKGALRHEANMLEVFGIEADYDGEQVSVDKAAAMLEFQNIEAMIYTSPSHCEERPRWRVLAPLSGACSVQERRRYVAMLNSALGGILAAESFAAAQCFFYGKVHGSAYRTRRIHGEPIDLNLVLEERYPSAMVKELAGPVTAPAPSANLDELRERMQGLSVATLTDYNGWLQAGMAAHHEASGAVEALDIWDEVSSKAPNYAGRDDLERKWESFGQRAGGPLCTITTLERLTGGAALLSEFDDVSAEADTAARLRFQVIPAAEFASGPPPRWIVRDVLPEAELCVVYGESGSGKSFFVLDLVAAVARGVQWQGRKVAQGAVVYVAAEGAGGFRKRLAAYAVHAGVALADVPVGVVPAAPNLLTNDDQDLAKAIAAAGGASVIVIDTLAQSTPGGNENAGEDMGKVLAHCKRLHAATGALIVLVHHSGKDASKGARGWSGIRAAVDAEIEITRTGEHRQAKITKQKDGEDDAAFTFCLQSVELGHDEDNFPITSCVVDFDNVPPSVPTRRMGQWEQLVYNVVSEFGMAQNSGIEIDAVIAEAVRQAPPPGDGKRDTRKQRVRRALDALTKGDDAPFYIEDGSLSLLV